MSAAEHLGECRNAISGCNLVAFIDLQASMVLSVSAASKQRQERLDMLGALASDLLRLPEDDPLQGLPGDGTVLPQTAIRLSATETTVFVRSQAEPNEALCCACAPDTRVDETIAAARRVLPDIGAND